MTDALENIAIILFLDFCRLPVKFLVQIHDKIDNEFCLMRTKANSTTSKMHRSSSGPLLL